MTHFGRKVKIYHGYGPAHTARLAVAASGKDDHPERGCVTARMRPGWPYDHFNKSIFFVFV
jgi:hypothetical protein